MSGVEIVKVKIEDEGIRLNRWVTGSEPRPIRGL